MEDSRKNERIINIEIYTDGSLKKSGQVATFGGWCFIAIQDSKLIFQKSGSEYGTTNQRMELIAVVEALKYAQSIRRNSEKIIIYSDSAYLINCYLKEWYTKWQINGWRNANNKEVANQDLWKEIIPFFDNFWYDFRKVKGHAGIMWNEKCDEMAQSEAEHLKKNWRGIQNYDR